MSNLQFIYGVNFYQFYDRIGVGVYCMLHKSSNTYNNEPAAP